MHRVDGESPFSISQFQKSISIHGPKVGDVPDIKLITYYTIFAKRLSSNAHTWSDLEANKKRPGTLCELYTGDVREPTNYAMYQMPRTPAF